MGSINIPTPEEAFIEAQKSSSPRDSYPWTHPIIYWAGKETGWELINSSQNTNAFQALVFCEELINSQPVSLPAQ